jgi:hypothetical protein
MSATPILCRLAIALMPLSLLGHCPIFRLDPHTFCKKLLPESLFIRNNVQQRSKENEKRESNQI